MRDPNSSLSAFGETSRSTRQPLTTGTGSVGAAQSH